jgi:glycerol-3-phosphate dehydrogenase
MVGGKWTTFRAFAEQTADEVLEALQAPRRCGTADLGIGGGRNFPDQQGALEETLAATCGVASDRAAHLAAVYGTRAADALGFCAGCADDQPLRPGAPETAAEIAWLIRNEHVVHLSDIVLRRTPLAITGRIDTTLINRVADIAAQELGWTEDQTAQERQALTAELRDYHGVAPETLERRARAGDSICA